MGLFKDALKGATYRSTTIKVLGGKDYTGLREAEYRIDPHGVTLIGGSEGYVRTGLPEGVSRLVPWHRIEYIDTTEPRTD